MSSNNHFLFEIGVDNIPRVPATIWLEEITNKLKNKFSFHYLELYISSYRVGFLFKGIVVEKKEEELYIVQRNKSLTKKENRIETDLLQKELNIINYLSTHLRRIITNSDFHPKMSWAPNTLFIRPIRWIIALYHDQLLPLNLPQNSFLQLGNLTNERYTSILNQSLLIKEASSYPNIMKEHGVIINLKERKEIILSQLKQYQIIEELNIIDELVHLSENPILLSCNFAEQFLEIEMIKFFLKILSKKLLLLFSFDNHGDISNQFFTCVSYGVNLELAREGWAQQVNNALTNLLFLIEKDENQLQLDKLKNISFFQDNLFQRTNRIMQISSKIANLLNFNQQTVQEISQFLYADSANAIIQEYPEMEGFLTYHYLKKTNLNIAQQIFSIHSGEPNTIESMIVVLSKELDYLFHIAAYQPNSLAKSSINDPYGCRKSINQIFLVLEHIKLSFTTLIQIVEKIENFTIQSNIIQNLFLQRAQIFFHSKKISYQDVDQFYYFHQSYLLIKEYYNDCQLLEKLEWRIKKLLIIEDIIEKKEYKIELSSTEEESKLSIVLSQLEKEWIKENQLFFIIKSSRILDKHLNLFLENTVVNNIQDKRSTQNKYCLLLRLLDYIKPLTQVSQFF
jgi:glycyl-tRNA synthetase beta subunit